MRAAAVLPLLLSLLVAMAHATETDVEAERRALAERKEAVDARHREALKACANQFKVNACEQAAREQRKQALAPVVARQREIDAKERLERAQRQRERVQAKQQAFVEADALRQQRTLTAPAALPHPSPASRPVRADPQVHAQQVKKEIAASERAASAARKQADKRRSEAQAHRESLQRRQQERAQRDKKGVALPPQPTTAEIAALPGGAPASAVSAAASSAR